MKRGPEPRSTAPFALHIQHCADKGAFGGGIERVLGEIDITDFDWQFDAGQG